MPACQDSGIGATSAIHVGEGYATPLLPGAVVSRLMRCWAGILVASSHTSKDLLSSSYLYLFLNILRMKFILEENLVATRGKWACPGPWSLTHTGQSHKRWHPEALSLSLQHPVTREARIE